MTVQEFELIFKEQVKKLGNTLITKRNEYAPTGDCLQNFKQGSALLNISPEECLFGYLTKHLCSIAEMVKSPNKYSIDKWDEKLGDVLSYGFLLKALVSERLSNSEKPSEKQLIQE